MTVTSIAGREFLDSAESAGARLVDIRELAGKHVHLGAEQIEERNQHKEKKQSENVELKRLSRK